VVNAAMAEIFLESGGMSTHSVEMTVVYAVVAKQLFAGYMVDYQ
jgi:hypothetical protein